MSMRLHKRVCFLITLTTVAVAIGLQLALLFRETTTSTIISHTPSSSTDSSAVGRNDHSEVLPLHINTTATTEKEDQDCRFVDDACLQYIARTRLSYVWQKHPWQSWCTVPDTSNLAAAGNETALSQQNASSIGEGGLVLIKVPKSASSTAAGVVLRIQHQHQCTAVQWQHQMARDYVLDSSTTKSSPSSSIQSSNVVRVAPIRDPTTRALSSVFFHKVSFHQQNSRQQQPGDGNSRRPQPSDTFLIKYLNETQHNFVLNYVAPQGVPMPHTPYTTAEYREQLVTMIQQVLEFYHFLFVVDRWDESLVVWSWLTGLPWTDLMTLSSKRSGGWYASGQRCIALIKPSASDGVKAFLDSKEWKLAHAGDRLLYYVATNALNRTIEEFMGHFRLEQDLVRFRQLRDQMQVACQNETFFPCSDTGVFQLDKAKENCYVRDFGCGYPCLDRFVEQHQQEIDTLQYSNASS